MSARTRKSLVLFWTALFVFSLALQYANFVVAPAPVQAATGISASTVSGFEIDGDLKELNAAGNPAAIPAGLFSGLVDGLDWLTAGLPDTNKVGGSYPRDAVDNPNDIAGDTVDDNSAYAGGNKEDDTTDWSYDNTAGPNGKTDFRHIFAHTKKVGNSAVVYFAAERVETNGVMVVDFEINNKPWKVFPGTPGIEKPDRSVGDLLISMLYSNGGSNPNVAIYTVTTVNEFANGQTVVWTSVNDATVLAAVRSATNFVDLEVGAGDSGLGYDIEAFAFAEASVDLSALNITLGCPGFSEGHLRSRTGAGNSPTSDPEEQLELGGNSQLKDFAEPFPVDLNNCGTLKIEKRNQAGALLPGATFTIDPDPRPGQTGMLTVTDGGANDPDGTANGIIEFDPAVPGTYDVCETVPPAGYKLPASPCQNDQVLANNGTLTLTFVDPLEVVATVLSLVSDTPDNGSFVTAGQQISLVVNEQNTGESVLTGVNVTGTNSCANWTAAANKNDGAGPFSGTLNPGESVNFSCTFNAPAVDDFTWSATGRGTDELGNPAPLTNEVVTGGYDILMPATTLTIEQDAPAQVHAGDSITIVVNEANTGEGLITAVTVTGVNSCANWTAAANKDDGDGAFSGSLAPGESVDFSCTFNAPLFDFTWEADGHGTDSLGDDVPATGEHVEGTVDVVTPSTFLTIKTDAPEIVYPGAEITIVVTETNTGDGTLSNVHVLGVNSCDTWSPANVASLGSGESVDFSCTFNAPSDDFSWSATAHGTDSLGDPAPLDNETVSGDVDVITPATVLTTKQAAPAIVYEGASITIIVTEANTGDSTLTDVHVTGTNSCADWTAAANKNDGDGAFSGSLEPGESVDFSCTFNAPADDFTWTALGHGTDELDNPAPDTNEDEEGDVEVITPATTLTLVSEDPDPVLAGGSTTITVLETNTGDSTLTSVHVLGSPCDVWAPVGTFDGILEPQESQQFRCFVADVGTENVEWDATGFGTDELGNPAPLDNEFVEGVVHVVNPDIDVVKTAGESLQDQAADGTVYETEDGTTVVYKYVVTTADPDGLIDVDVTDDLCSPVTAVEDGGHNVGDTDDDDRLEPGEEWIFTCSAFLTIENDGVEVHNIATASGQPIVGPRVDDDDPADVELLTPDIDIVKTAGDAEDGEVYVTEAFPNNVLYTYEITNTGELDLFDVEVVDDLGTASTSDDLVICTLEVLLVGESDTCTKTLTVLVDTTNVAVVTGHTEQKPEDDVTADDDAVVDIVAPDIRIIKTAGTAADGQVYVTEAFPNNVTYKYAITNIGEVDLFDVVVVDDRGTPAVTTDDITVCTIPELLIEETENCQVTLTVNQTTTNVAVATGHTEQQPEEDVTDDDDAVVRVPDTGIDKTNNDADGVVGHGQEVTYTILVEVVQGPVTNAVVTDTLPTGQTYVTGSQTSNPAAATFNVSGDGRTLTWTYASLPSGDPALTITYKVTIDANAPTGNQTNVAQICVSELEDCKTDTTTVRVPLLTIVKSFVGNTGGTAPDGSPEAKIGDVLTYTLAYDLTNGPVTNGVITDTLPVGLAYVAGSATNNAEFTFQSFNAATRTLTWTAPTVTADGSVTYRATVLTGSDELPQPLVNVATIDSNETDKDDDTKKVFVEPPPLAETATPTLPPTDSLYTGSQGSSNPGFSLMLLLLALGGFALVIGFITPVPERVRRRGRLG